IAFVTVTCGGGMADFGGSEWQAARTRKGDSKRQDFLRAECKGDSKRFDELGETVFCNNFAILRNQDNGPTMTRPLFTSQRSSYCYGCGAPSRHPAHTRPPGGFFVATFRCRYFAFGHLRMLEKGEVAAAGDPKQLPLYEKPLTFECAKRMNAIRRI